MTGQFLPSTGSVGSASAFIRPPRWTSRGVQTLLVGLALAPASLLLPLQPEITSWGMLLAVVCLVAGLHQIAVEVVVSRTYQRAEALFLAEQERLHGAPPPGLMN